MWNVKEGLTYKDNHSIHKKTHAKKKWDIGVKILNLDYKTTRQARNNIAKLNGDYYYNFAI